VNRATHKGVFTRAGLRLQFGSLQNGQSPRILNPRQNTTGTRQFPEGASAQRLLNTHTRLATSTGATFKHMGIIIKIVISSKISKTQQFMLVLNNQT